MERSQELEKQIARIEEERGKQLSLLLPSSLNLSDADFFLLSTASVLHDWGMTEHKPRETRHMQSIRHWLANYYSNAGSESATDSADDEDDDNGLAVHS